MAWLDSRHTFSFGEYHDPRWMGVSALRVINDDRVAPGAGFPPHSHRDMEIITYVKKGAIEHKDSIGHVEILREDEFQLMSAGRGVTHSEFNPSGVDTLEFLQIWIRPSEFGIDPAYQQKEFPRVMGSQLIASPDSRDGSLKLHQDARLYRIIVTADAPSSHALHDDRTVYIQVVAGKLEVEGDTLRAGDGAGITGVRRIEMAGAPSAEALLFDLP